ncbi:MAG: hypothetical protein ABIR81_04680 [Ginsengibacter sp.]
MKFIFLLVATVVFSSSLFSQKITYSQPEREDTRSMLFEVVGKVSGNYLVYKNIRTNNDISVYDNEMKLKERVKLDFIPDRTFNVDFVAYQDFSYIIYQFQKRNVVYCMAAKIDGNAKKIGEPIELDTTSLSVFADNKIYNTIFSEDRKQIVIYKIQKKNEKFNFTTLLFNTSLELQQKSRWVVPYEERRDVYNDFFVDNDGNFVFAKSEKASARDLLSKVLIVTKPPTSDTFFTTSVNLNNLYLDEVKLKVDNINKRLILNSFYYSQKRGNIEGLFIGIWDRQMDSLIVQNTIKFNDTLRRQAKANGTVRIAFNDFFIKNIILKKDGGFLLTGEDYYTQSRSTPWNRYDFLNNYSSLSSFNYYNYSPAGYWYRPRGWYGNNSQTRYYYDNIVVMDISKNGKLQWANILHKSQFDDETDNFLSYQIMNTGDELHFLFNELERRNQLIADQSITWDGRLKRNPTLKSLDKGYEFMPKFAKQVSGKQIIVPCTMRNYICFAKIDY